MMGNLIFNTMAWVMMNQCKRLKTLLTSPVDDRPEIRYSELKLRIKS
jgi:hypothetical protein